MTPQHHIIKETSETLSRLLQDEFKRNGYKRVHIVEQAPKPDAVEGKLPAVSVYLYQLSLDPEGSDATVHSEIVEVGQDDGTVKEYLRRRRLWVRLDYLVSAWAQTPEDEQLLLGLIIRTVMDNPELARDRLKGGSFEDDFKLNFLLSSRLDEGTLARFWGSLNQPVRPAVQAWTAIPTCLLVSTWKRSIAAPSRLRWSAPARSKRRFWVRLTKGPVNEPCSCSNWSQFTKHFGDFQNSEYLAHAVYGFFNNGGSRCFVLNVGPLG
jgi:hypothetical protein